VETPVTVAHSREDAALIARGILIERTRVAKANEWLFDTLLMHASDMEKRGASFMDVDPIRVAVRRLRITTC
jgi:hypothetical protein